MSLFKLEEGKDFAKPVNNKKAFEEKCIEIVIDTSINKIIRRLMNHFFLATSKI